MKEFFKHPLPRGVHVATPHVSTTSARVDTHTCHSFLAGAYFRRNCGPICARFSPCLPFTYNTPSLREPCHSLDRAHTKGKHSPLFSWESHEIRLPGVPPRRRCLSPDCVFMRAEISEDKPRHTPGRSFPRVDDINEIVF